MAEILARRSKDYVKRLMKSVLERTASDERDCAMKKYLPIQVVRSTCECRKVNSFE